MESTEILDLSFFLLISSDSCHKKMLLESLNIPLTDDPTGKYKRKLVNILSALKKGGKISEAKYKYLYPTAENVPRLHYTPMIHKNNNLSIARHIVD